eukprot:554959_1
MTLFGYQFYLLCQFIALIDSTNLPFSWSHVPIFAFPGFHHGFLTESDITKYSLNSFDQLLLCAFNVSCQNPKNGNIYPAQLSNSYYSCGSDHTFYANMEQSLQYQAYDLKTNLIKNKPNLKVFGYIESTNVQQSYVYQQRFNSDTPPFNTYHLQLDNMGVINCYTDNCDWQGPSYRQYDHRQQSVRDYFVNSVVYNLINSTFIDGVFIDSVSSWPVVLCPEWKCTPTEYQQLFDGSLNVTLQTVDLLHNLNKIGIISAHVDMFHFADYYWKYRQILQKYNGDHSIRFYECVESYYWGSSFYNHFVTLLNESAVNMAIHFHNCKKKMNPDWVELAAFLIVANNQSWFSYSEGWTVEQPWYQTEFGNSLGQPFGDANCTNDRQWHVFEGINNLAYSDAIAGGNSSDGMIIYIGMFDSYEQCMEAVQIHKEFGSFNWIDDSGGVWKNMCYGKYGGSWMNYPQKNTVSGHLGNLYCTRQFANASVQFDILYQSANITWKGG